MNILIDGDACPVKDIIIEEAIKREIPVTIVTSFAHFSNAPQPPGVKTVYVDSGADAADFKIIQLAKRGDLLVTQDYGLASLALPKGLTVLHHKGFAYDNSNMERLLEDRYMSAMVRKSGKRTKGPKPYTDADRHTFRMLLTSKLQET